MRSVIYEKSVSIFKHTKMTDEAWKQHGPMIISIRYGVIYCPFSCRFSVTKSGNENSGTSFILVDEVRYAEIDLETIYSDGYPDGSATINIELTAGQIVRVENIISTVVYGTDPSGYLYSWFTGHLLYAL